MKPNHWLDLVDIAIRVLSIIRHLLTELWNGRGNDGENDGGDDGVNGRVNDGGCR